MLGPDGWNILGLFPPGELDRLTELERMGSLTDQMLGLAIAGITLPDGRARASGV